MFFVNVAIFLCLFYEFGNSPSTVIPMLRAVPATIFMADSILKQLRSDILALAMSFTLSLVIEPTCLRYDSAEPDCNLRASFNMMATGGCFMIKSNDLSA